MKYDVRKAILFNAVKNGKINSIESLIDIMIFLGFKEELKGRCFKLRRVSSEHLKELGTTILTGSDKK